MFDPVTRDFLSTAPSLPGLPAETLADEFTSTYVEIAAARLALAQSDSASVEHLEALSDRMTRLANTFESQVILGIAKERTRAAAFVAASARQVVFQISHLTTTESSTRVDEDAISSDIAAALLFLIAERTADSYEASRFIDAKGMRGLHGQIAIAISNLARGQLERISELEPSRFRTSQPELTGTSASDLLYSYILDSLHLLAQACLGIVEFSQLESAQQQFREAKELAVDVETFEPSLEIAIAANAPSILPGPHHLAGLLERAARTLRDAAVIRIISPSGANAEKWGGWLKTEAQRFPFIWENHQRAISTGFLDVGKSLVMTSPTGSGKTTLATLKIASTLCAGKTVVYLAPTHALVNQVERDLNERLGDLARASSIEESLLEEIGQYLPEIAVLTPERCFALLTFAPLLFKNVGLLVFDECHLMGLARAAGLATGASFDRRSVDAMLCLLTFAAINKTSDYLLLSAMISNGGDIAAWLHKITERPCYSFDDKWKPTRQLKACVCYERDEIDAVEEELETDAKKRKTFPKSVPAAVKAMANASPVGLFLGSMGWHPKNPDTYALRALTSDTLPLGVARRAARRRWGITANRNEVAAELAIQFYNAGLKVVVFCESLPTTNSVARRINEAANAIKPNYDETQQGWRKKLIEELGSEDGIYDAGKFPAAVHHGELLLEERLLVEQLFRNRNSGLNVLAATSTLAQGLNLPCEVVILAGTDRIDESDPQDTKRTDLMPHEILNALGRAGRAGLSATGLAVVVPANIVYCNLEEEKIEDDQLLHTIFSSSDQCAPLSDPISGLYDQIIAHGSSGKEASYLLKRLALSLSKARAGVETFDNLTRRSFGFYLKARDDAKAAESWLTERRQQLEKLIEAANEDKERDWIQELAAKSGSSPSFITALSDAFSKAPFESPDAHVWMTWLLNQLPLGDDDFDTFIRPDDVERVFGRGYTSAASELEGRERARNAILSVLPAWFGAAPLNVLETKIVEFINAHEGDVSRPTAEDGKAKRGRRFALRLVSDLSYLAGVLAQIAAHTANAQKQEPLAITQSLPQLVRRGFNTPYHLFLDRQTPGRSRQTLDQNFKDVGSKVKREPSDEWDVIRNKLAASFAASLFDDVDFASIFKIESKADPEATSSTPKLPKPKL